MESTFPKTPPRRGRSRFSKALPLPPEPQSPRRISKDRLGTLPSTPISLHSPLPPIPKNSPPIPSSKTTKMAIPRRPVGGAPRENTKANSIASVSSVYSDAESLVFSRSLSNGTNKTKDSFSDSEIPPIPPKDTQRQQQTPKSTTESPASGFQSSPSRPEIWRRRSRTVDRSIVVPELKLDKSNGSTASPPRQPQLERDLPAVPSQLPRSQGRKPVPLRPAPPQPEFGGMGEQLSKLKAKTKTGSPNASEDATPPIFPPFQIKRLPTPEYLKTDKQQQQPMTPTVLSPLSPETSPVDGPPAVPQNPESRSTNTVTDIPENVLANKTNRPDILSSHSRDTSETLTITSEPQAMRSPQPQKSYAAAKILTAQSPPPSTDKIAPLASSLSTSTTPPLASPAAVPSPVNQLNIQFPKVPTPVTPGTILQGLELGIVHLECYHSHALMRKSKNILCPVACMVCRKKEMGPRWRCSWCCLSACGACMQVLTSVPGRDLRVALERLERTSESQGNGQGSGSGR